MDTPFYLLIDNENRQVSEHATLDDVVDEFGDTAAEFIRAMRDGEVEVYEVKRKVPTPSIIVQWS